MLVLVAIIAFSILAAMMAAALKDKKNRWPDDPPWELI
jgi:hypothetical protein